MGFFSSIFNSSGNGATGTIDEAIKTFQGLKAPTAADLTYELNNLVRQGLITPEQAKAYLVDKSAAEDISVDPRLKAAQMSALSDLQDITKAGGMTAMDQSKVGAVLSQLNQQERGSRDAIMQREAEMGRAGSGTELASLLESDQGAATRASQQGTDIAAQAQQRALDAINQTGALSSQARGQDFSEQAQQAEAKDAMAKFNAEHLQSTNAANVATQNAAQAANLAEKQRVSDTNAQIAGQNREIAANAHQTSYQDEMDRRKAIADALAAKAQAQQNVQKQNATTFGSLVGAGGSVGAGLIAKSDERSKNVSRETPDMDSFMAALKPLMFKYKDPESPGASPGENVGVVAQDVEKTPVGKTMVKNTPDGKMLDLQKGFGVILAALAALHDKIEGDEKEPANGD